MPKQRITTAELAKLRIPGYPTTAQGWDKRVRVEKWPVEVVRGRGRGGERREYTPPAHVQELIQRCRNGELPTTYLSIPPAVDRSNKPLGLNAHTLAPAVDFASKALLAMSKLELVLDSEMQARLVHRLFSILLLESGSVRRRFDRLVESEAVLDAALRYALALQQIEDDEAMKHKTGY